ncbi:L-glutamine synthetase [Rubrobacter xylanophilus DSM 9941]|uniref:L-glutamine synthetase n=1 Tax=Rubrobacter xylanophilus (strain DSM 9941 / JCM 11954 / NBRC 16129 / PRD-1) TaxID=266117 RepID=Q1AT56_RUBXD|nr:L-glutamine synthetase [Rubrobacter xylanophilus DSM 9941]
MDLQEAKNFLEKNNVRYVLAQFVNIHGVSKTKAVPVKHFENVVTEGAGFAAFAVGNLGLGPETPDYMAVGDLSTLTLVPWMPGYARIVCEGHMRGEPWHYDPRVILKKQTQRLKERGWTFYTGLEPEFFLLARDEENGLLRTADPTDVLEKPCYDYKGLARQRNFLETITEILGEVGIDVYQIDHEDANGQFEINFFHKDCVFSADDMIFFRMAAVEVARRSGMVCSFMPKPFADRTGNSMHIHHSIADEEDNNLFEDKNDPQGMGLSKLAYQFLGGIMAHAPALTVFNAPSVNSYKRLAVGSSRSGATWAPAHVSYGPDNRSALVRVPAGRLELRLTDSGANPYLATAALIAAGLDGIDRNLDPGEPCRDNLYALSSGDLQRRNIRQLPSTLNAACDALEADSVICEALGADFVEEFLETKRQEWDRYNRHVSEWEIDRYLEFWS